MTETKTSSHAFLRGKRALLGCAIIYWALLIPTHLFAQFDPAVNDVLTAAEKTFTAMEEKDYPEIWQLLTGKTKSTIVCEVQALSPAYSKEQITLDLRVGGLMAGTYWNSFLENFDPDQVLEQSRWEMGFIKEDEALIRLIYPRSERPAELRLYLEGGKWKVGLVESFWGRK